MLDDMANKGVATLYLVTDHIPTIRELDAEFQKLVKEKNQIYSEFKIARTEMMELLSAKQNVEHFLGEQNRLEQDIQKKKGDTSL